MKVGLDKLVDDTCADEPIVMTDIYQQVDRLDSYRRVAGHSIEDRGDARSGSASLSIEYETLPAAVRIGNLGVRTALVERVELRTGLPGRASIRG